MTIENGVRLLVGIMLLASIALVYFFGNGWLLLIGFIALNLIQSVFTGICPANTILRKLGCKESGGSCKIDVK